MIKPRLRTSVLVAALAATAAYAGSTNLNNSSYVPGASTYNLEPDASTTAVRADASMDAGATTTTVPAATPAIEQRDEGVTVTEKRLTEDQRIQAQVMDRIASDTRLSGKVGVESKDRVVRLSGYTLTSGQARHAERDAWGVTNVKHVVNEIRPRVGGITS